jgi:hypothetical protein
MVYMSKMDADIQQQIRHEVVNAVAQRQNALMSHFPAFTTEPRENSFIPI